MSGNYFMSTFTECTVGCRLFPGINFQGVIGLEVYLCMQMCIIITRSFIHSEDLYSTSTQRRSQPSRGQRRRTSGRCKILKGYYNYYCYYYYY